MFLYCKWEQSYFMQFKASEQKLLIWTHECVNLTCRLTQHAEKALSLNDSKPVPRNYCHDIVILRS